MNYLLSGWIENLGVVPLLLFAFFLLAPAFLAFSRLLVLVCCVFEAICCLPLYLIRLIIIKFKPVLISTMQQVVKVFSYILLTLGISQSVIAKDWFLSIGEQVEINTEQISKFSVGNKQILGHKFNPQSQNLLIKAKAIGFSDVILWHSRTKKTTHRFYISSKKEHLTKMEILQALKHTSLKTQMWGDFVQVKGTSNRLDHFLIYNQIKKSKDFNFIWDIHLTKKLRNTIYKYIYIEAYKKGVTSIECQAFKNAIIECHFSANQKLTLTSLEKKFGASITQKDSLKMNQNYQVFFHILMLENKDLNTNSFGIENINLPLHDLLADQAQLTTSDILFENQESRVRTLSKQNVSTILNESFTLRLGSEIPFKTTNSQNITTTDWKFVGLKIKGQLALKNEKFILKQNSQLTTPSQEGVAGPQSQSQIFLDAKEPTKIFEIEFETDQLENKGVPILKSIPVLNTLFRSSTNVQSKKKIVGFISIQGV